MNELTRILRLHAARYPQMEPADAVKLIYQNEFGGGHLIRDGASCLEYLRNEYTAVQKDPAALKCEDIGNGLVRVYLSALCGEELEQLGQRFLSDWVQRQGSLASFLEKLSVLRQVTGEGCFSFDSEALDAYLTAYAAAGYPMVSHSDSYRAAYRPAYRVIRSR